MLKEKNKALMKEIKELKALNQLKINFLSNISHELRTPLHAILGFTQIILDEKLSQIPDHYREFTKDIQMSARQMLNLVNNLLDLAKIESGKTNIVAENFPLSDLIMEITEIFKPVILKKNFSFIVKISPEVEMLYTDKNMLRQIIHNYLSNAFKFTPANGKISLRIFPAGNQLFQIDVKDNGIGISKAGLSHLFNEFHQVDGTKSTEYAGSGLGLSLAMRFANALGGDVKVKSAKGKGSIFSVILPLSIPENGINS